MSLLIALPPKTPLPLLADLAWHASHDLMEAARAGNRQAATLPALWLSQTRDHPNCSPALARVAGHALEIGLATFGGTVPAFSPLQPDDGEDA